uniref:Uncharacterized protein n=1 Tax=viral metagenome TaxID=1070528 RepID=A0A6C0CIL9_9ZZZZ
MDNKISEIKRSNHHYKMTLYVPGDLIYFVLPVPGKTVPQLLLQLLGRIVDTSPTHYEVRRAEDSIPSFGISGLPKEFHPIVHADEANDTLDVVRIPHSHAVAKIDADSLTYDLVFSVFSVQHVGWLARITYTRPGGREETILGRVVNDIVFHGNVQDGSCIVKTFKPPKSNFDIFRPGKTSRSGYGIETQVGLVAAPKKKSLGKKAAASGRDDCLLHFFPYSEDYKIEFKMIDEGGRNSLAKYLERYGWLLVNSATSLRQWRREIVSAVRDSTGKDKQGHEISSWFAFTKENSFLSESLQIAAPELAFCKNFPSLIDITNDGHSKPKVGDVVYGLPVMLKDDPANKGGRDSLQWFNASDCPGLDAFLCFANGGSRKPNLVERARGPQGEANIFSELLEGYFNPQITNSTVARFKKLYLWQFTI